MQKLYAETIVAIITKNLLAPLGAMQIWDKNGWECI